MTTYHEGQEVEVKMKLRSTPPFCTWEKAKIVQMEDWPIVAGHGDRYLVEFADGSRCGIEDTHIRPVKEDRVNEKRPRSEIVNFGIHDSDVS